MSLTEYKEECRRLLNEIHSLLGTIIKVTKSSDEKAKANKVPWHERHRLHILIDTARSAISRNDYAAASPWFIVELRSIVSLVKRWKKTKIWNLIEPELKSKTSFLHTIGQLILHDILIKNGNNVKIVSTEKRPTPDLILYVNSDTQEIVYLEVYHPQRFAGKPDPLSNKELSKIVEKSMKKARRQLSESHPGIIAIIGHSQHPANFQKLKGLMARRLDETNRPYLAGCIFLDIGVTAVKGPSKTTFTRTAKLSYISNPSYFGSVKVITDGDEETSPTIPIIERAISVNTTGLIGKKISYNDLYSEAIVEEICIEHKIITLQLETFDNPDPNIETIITSEKEIALFIGDSNRNFICSNCSKILAEKVWPYSLFDIVIKCPKCHYFSKFPQVRSDFPNYPNIKIMGIAAGEYNYSESVRLKRSISLIGRAPKPTVKK